MSVRDPQEVDRRRTTLFLAALGMAVLAAVPGCGGSGDKEVEIVAPVTEAPVHNPQPSKSPYAKINPDNEAEYIDKVSGAVPGR